MKKRLPAKAALLKIRLIFLIGILYEFYRSYDLSFSGPSSRKGIAGSRMLMRALIPMPGEDGTGADSR
jgi:hypothetical protein